jgi:hypothetical protein
MAALFPTPFTPADVDEPILPVNDGTNSLPVWISAPPGAAPSISTLAPPLAFAMATYSVTAPVQGAAVDPAEPTIA